MPSTRECDSYELLTWLAPYCERRELAQASDLMKAALALPDSAVRSLRSA
jgi:hypothetical protein